MLKTFDDTVIRDEIEAAVRKTLSMGIGANQSLCHGALGNLEFLLQAAHTLSKPELLISANRFKHDILESLNLKTVCEEIKFHAAMRSSM
jgi:lantibiotic modifying enzyme